MILDALSQTIEFYGERTAARSKVPLMNHIYEGISILDKMNASDETKAAWILHPLSQGEEAYTATDKVKDLAESYAITANSYLCCPETDNYTFDDMPVMPSTEVGQMLYADKLQNYKDFLLYHYGTHERSEQLNNYFQNWLVYLTVS